MKWDKHHRDLLADNWTWDGDGVYERRITPLVSVKLVASGLNEHFGADSRVEARRFGAWDLAVRTVTFNKEQAYNETRICSYRDFGWAARAVLGNF